MAQYADDLARQIRTTLGEYAELSQSLDRSFPHRLVETKSRPSLEMSQISTRLAELESKRQQLMDAGLLGKDEHTQIPATSNIKPAQQEVLSVYVEDAEKKLHVFDSLFERIELFREIIGRRLLFKEMIVNKKDGIAFRTSKGEPLSATSLSTGEQHEIVLLYELLFKVKKNSLILIDEPEISLHVAWQKEFLSDLQQITRLSQVDVLIATHSPDIINDRWDLTVELKEPVE